MTVPTAQTVSLPVVATPPMPETHLQRLRWAVLDAWTVTGRDLAHWVRQPATLVMNLLFMVMVVLMFGYLFGGAMTVPGGGSYREFLLPGMFALSMLFGVESTMVAVTTDAARGVTDRFRSMPMARSAVVAGRGLADMLNSVLGLGVLLACGLLVGWRWHNSAAEALAAVALLLLLRFALIWVGVYLGLLVRNPEAVMAVQILVWPLGFLSNAIAPTATMPGWLGAVAEWNPVSATVSATRELFGNPGWGGASWADQHAPLLAVLWPLLILAVFVPLAVRRWQRLSR
jgi:ABC-2 type transport system permease protein